MVFELQMESSSQSRAAGGLWNNPRATQYSKETQNMMRLMIQESKLTHRQRKQINECLENGAPLPLSLDRTPSASPPQPKTSKSVQKSLPGTSQRRSAESCRSGDSYVREKFRPRPTRDLEKEKRRLQNIMETGEEEPTAASSKNVPGCRSPDVAEQKDPYQQVLDEIEERRQFLADMSSLGQQQQYFHIINAEISQRMRELRVLEKTRGLKKDQTSERDELTDGAQ
ncbi:UPF0193 protein EVG1 [Centropristis striata]|uniref:UPF0193 protein EVG1 n=1 Tax=Centropristis striata TaxID=184440 RepID=UPI0027E10487|nr:UPF0193 protein EVG1 [Centropristis striata]